MRPILVTPLAAALALSACGGGADTPQKVDTTPRRITIEGARKNGRHADVAAKGVAERPVAVAIRISAAPKQRVIVSWGLSCPRTPKGSDRNPSGGTYSATPPDVRPLRLPRRTIAFCAVNAHAQLAGTGRVKIAVLASERPAP